MPPVALVTDSTACLPAPVRYGDGGQVQVVPLHVLIDGASFVEGVDIQPADVAQALREHRRVSTSKPSAGDFLDAYERAAADGAEAIVSVHLSAAMSGTLSSAQVAASESPIPVTVIDSETLAMGLGFAVESAARQASSDRAGVAAVAAAARRRAAASTCLFVVDTLEYLRRGGRIGRASAWLGTALAMRPLLHVADGVVAPLERVRTTGKAMALLADRISAAVEDAGPGEGTEVAVQHLDAAERAQSLAEVIQDRCPQVGEVRVVGLSAVVGAHTGPGVVGAVVAPRASEPPVIGVVTD
ncbi:DegV family protein [Dermacoccaceae bacterium W4C1]